MLRLRGKVQGKNFSGLAVHLFSFKKTFKNNFLIIGMQSWNGYVVSADFCALSPIHEAWKRMWGWFQTLYHFSSSLSGKKWTYKHTREKLELLFKKSKPKLGSSYSKTFQLTFEVPKLDFTNLKWKIDLEYLIHRSKNISWKSWNSS